MRILPCVEFAFLDFYITYRYNCSVREIIIYTRVSRDIDPIVIQLFEFIKILLFIAYIYIYINNNYFSEKFIQILRISLYEKIS